VAALRLVQKELCDAALFDPSGQLSHCTHRGLVICQLLSANSFLLTLLFLNRNFWKIEVQKGVWGGGGGGAAWVGS